MESLDKYEYKIAKEGKFINTNTENNENKIENKVSFKNMYAPKTK